MGMETQSSSEDIFLAATTIIARGKNACPDRVEFQDAVELLKRLLYERRQNVSS
jgi:hypothetical protein